MILKAVRYHTRPRTLPALGSVQDRKVEPQPANAEGPFVISGQIPQVIPDRARITALDAIRMENISDANLVQARFMAFEKGLRPSSDLHAVVLLREAGIPFPAGHETDIAVPAGRDIALRSETLPDPVAIDPPAFIEGKSAIFEVRQDLQRRRRMRSLASGVRIAIFVGLPTLLAWDYFNRQASLIYASHSEFVIQSSDGGAPMAQAGAMAGMAGLAGGGAQDAIALQGFLTSRPAFERLDREHGFVAALSSDSVDPIRRISQDATREDAFEAYLDHVEVGFDPTEGIIRLRVLALNPEDSVRYSNALYSYAGERLEQMTEALREGRLRSSVNSVSRAEKQVKADRDALVGLQEMSSSLSAEAETTLLQEQIGSLEAELTKVRLSLSEMDRNARPNKARRESLSARVAYLEAEIDILRGKISGGADGSMARIQAEIELTRADLESSQEILTQSRVAFEAARADADARAKYLALAVEPTVTDNPHFPRVLEHTLMAFCAFFGIYLLASLTLTMIREQIAS